MGGVAETTRERERERGGGCGFGFKRGRGAEAVGHSKNGSRLAGWMSWFALATRVACARTGARASVPSLGRFTLTSPRNVQAPWFGLFGANKK